MKKTTVSYVFLGVFLALSVSCSSSNDASALGYVRGLSDSADRSRSYSNVVGALPQPGSRADELSSTDGSQLVVVGSIREVLPGVGASWSEDGLTRTLREYGSKDSEMSTIHLTVDVLEVVASGSGLTSPSGDLVGSTLTVGLWMPATPSINSVSKELTDLGRVVLFLSRRPTFYYKHEAVQSDVTTGIWAILESGAFLGQLSDDDMITFPAMGDGTRAELAVEDGVSLSALVKAGRVSGD